MVPANCGGVAIVKVSSTITGYAVANRGTRSFAASWDGRNTFPLPSIEFV
jgi:hypothetical protein